MLCALSPGENWAWAGDSAELLATAVSGTSCPLLWLLSLLSHLTGWSTRRVNLTPVLFLPLIPGTGLFLTCPGLSTLSPSAPGRHVLRKPVIWFT